MSADARFAELERRLTSLEDESQIRRLMSRHQRLSDDTYSGDWATVWGDSARLTGVDFAATAVPSGLPATWEGRGLSEHGFGAEPQVGKEESVEFSDGRQVWMPRMLHHLTNEHIDVVGEREATGHWYSWEAAIVLLDEEYIPVWIAGRFRVDFDKSAGEWRIAKIRFEEVFSAHAGSGDWVNEAHVQYGPGQLTNAE